MAERRNSSTELLLAAAAACAIFALTGAFQYASRDSIASLRQQWVLNPGDTRVRGQLVDKLVSAGRTEEALELLRSSLAANPNDGQLGRRLVELLLSSGKTDDAIELLRGQLRIHPEDWAGRETLADMLRSSGKMDEAQTLYTQVIAKVPDSMTARHGLARVLVLKGDTLAAQRVLEENLKRNPDDPATNELLADLAIKSLGDIARPIAQKYYERALKGDPSRAGAALALSKIYVAQNWMEEAAKVLAKPASLDRKNAALHVQYADVLTALHRYGEAAVQYDQGTAADPTNADVFARWGAMLVEAGKPVPAETVLRRAVEINDAIVIRTPALNTRSAEYHLQLARALRDQALTGFGGTVTMAMKEFMVAIDRDSRYVPVYLELARSLEDAHDEKSAENFLRDALRIEPGHTGAKVQLAKLLLKTREQGRHAEEAMELLALAVSENHSRDINLLVDFAAALGAGGKYEMAIEQMDVAIANARAASVVPWQIELLAEIRQKFRMVIAPGPEGHSSFNSVDGMVIRDPAEEPWPEPGQPTVRSLAKFPLDISRPPGPGNALDPRLYMGSAIQRPLGEFNGMPVLGVSK